MPPISIQASRVVSKEGGSEITCINERTIVKRILMAPDPDPIPLDAFGNQKKGTE
jgi:hypothetical protein